MAVGRRQFSGFRDRVVKARFYRHFTRPTRRQMMHYGFDQQLARVPLIQALDDNNNPIRGQLILWDEEPPAPYNEIEDGKVLGTELEVAVLPADNYAPNLQDLGLNTYYEFVAYPKYTIGGLTETDIIEYPNPLEADKMSSLIIDRPINDPGGFQALLLNSLAKPR